MTSSLPKPPPYGSGSLTDLLPAVACHLAPELTGPADGVDPLGLPAGVDPFGLPAEVDPFGLPDARAYVLLLVDGLGWRQLTRHLELLGYVSYLLADARPISAAVPSTTAVSLTSLGTGSPPGRHGVVGYTFRPAVDAPMLNALRWGTDDPVPELLQPHATWFERLADTGVQVTSIGRALFADSGLTRAGLRGGRHLAVGDHAGADERIDAVKQAISGGQRSFVYLYEGDLDHTGHGQGVDSDAWRNVLTRIDHDLELLRAALPADTCILVTGDHGMVDVPAHRQIVMEDDPQLMAGVDQLAGEGRFRQLYSAEPRAVAERWKSVLGDEAWVCTRNEALSAGWFGADVEERVLPRIGDVLVAMRGDRAVMTRQYPGEMNLVGQHGSLTDSEMLVPLLVDPEWLG